MIFFKELRFSSAPRGFAVLASAALVGGCATLPSSGPTGAQIEKSADTLVIGQDVMVVELDSMAALPAAPERVVDLLPTLTPPPTDMIGPGDVLEISIYEAGVALFGGGGTSSGATAAFDPSVKTERLPPSRVDDQGFIQIPYAGRIKVLGSTVAELESKIRRSLRGMSQNPQVLVTIRESITNSVIIGGEVGKPGRLVLPTNRETISDAVALAGGYRGNAKDIIIRVLRRGQAVDLRLGDILSGEGQDYPVYPGDRISLLSSPRSFSVLGAPGKVDQFPFSASSVYLAQAVAQAGGANPNTGDPAAVFVFRFNRNEQGVEIPTIYHLNMMKAGSYFLSQRFVMRDKDVLYFGNAQANQPSKLIQIISQLFAPIVTVRDIARSVN